jgi:hypothetical protein
MGFPPVIHRRRATWFKSNNPAVCQVPFSQRAWSFVSVVFSTCGQRLRPSEETRCSPPGLCFFRTSIENRAARSYKRRQKPYEARGNPRAHSCAPHVHARGLISKGPYAIANRLKGQRFASAISSFAGRLRKAEAV